MTNNFNFAKLDINVARDGSFKGAPKSVYMTLSSHADNNNTRKCFLKVKTIAKESGYCERTVRNALHKLQAWGLIEITEQFINEGGKRQQINSVYTLIGNEAACYQEYSVGEIPELLDSVIPPCKNCTTPLQKVTGQNESHINNKDSLTGEAELPAKNSELVNPETFTPEDAPDIMKPTAEYLLFKTGRKTLIESEISALRTLSASHYPARVQKEIDRACERFKRKNKPLSTLTFNYIAGALANQQSRKPAGKSGRTRVKSQDKSMLLTSAEINSRKKIPDEDLDAELARLESLMNSPVKAAQSLRRC